MRCRIVANPFQNVLARFRADGYQPDAASLPGAIGPHDLAIRLDRRTLAGQCKLEVAPVAFDHRAHNLAAQPFFTDVEQDSARIRPETDIGQLAQALARVRATVGVA
jgi:hypothetical protein